MKKLFITAALASTCIFASAQDMMSKRGTPILPEAGDWSIGAGADNLIGYFGNLFNKDANNYTSLNSQVPMTLVGLYVKDETTAFRAKLRIGFTSDKQDAFITDNTGTPPDQTTDTWKSSSTGFTLGLGIQKWRGKGRLHGLYGAEVGFGITGHKDTYEYGNDFSSTVTAPSSTDFGTGNIPAAGVRVTEDKDGSTFMVGLTGFIGAEYFFAPKMSLSAEYGWGFNFASTGEGEMTTEHLNSTLNGSDSETTKTAGNSHLSLDVIDLSSITLHFYF